MNDDKLKNDLKSLSDAIRLVISCIEDVDYLKSETSILRLVNNEIERITK